MSLEKARKLAEAGEYEASWRQLKAYMEQEPNDPQALVAGSYIMQQMDNWPVAYHFAKSCVKEMPKRSEPWINLSACCDQLYLYDEGYKAARKAIEVADTPSLKASANMNLASLFINNGKFKEAENTIRESLKQNPNSDRAKGNLGMALLAQGKWKEGWENYAKCLGLSKRLKLDYGLPEWDGTPESRVVVYGEQGLGDEISFASVYPDLQEKGLEVIIECDHRLKGLFQRSFPFAYVHGGRWRDLWDGEADYQCAAGNLGKFYRNNDADFPQTKYLVADPIRRAQWRFYKHITKKPLIGIAWTGGVSHTGSKYRKISKAQLQAITQGIDANFVSLEYKPHDEVPNINVFPHATLTKDYDDTAALVAECDLVITIQTAVAHLAGALGVPCIVMVPDNSQWRYAAPKFLWYTENFHVHHAPWDIKGLIENAKRIIELRHKA